MRGTTPGLASLCRLDRALVGRVRDRRDLLPIYLTCVVVIAVGAAAYGATMGMWRAPSQALFASLKLVGLFGGLLLLTTVANAAIGGLLRCGLDLKQTATCCALGVATTAAILGAVAPVSWFFVRHAPAPHPHDPASLSVAHQLLTAHVVVFAAAGFVGVRQVYVLVRDLVEDPIVARRALWAWLLIEGLVGAELSWILRPFLGKPNLAVSFVRADAFDRSFFEEIIMMSQALLGSAGPWIMLAMALAGAVAVATSLDTPTATHFTVNDEGLCLQYPAHTSVRRIEWADLRFVRRVDDIVQLGHADSGSLTVDVLTLSCDCAAAARDAYEAIERARCRGPDPYREDSSS